MEEQKKNKLESINGLLVEQGSAHDVLVPWVTKAILRVWVKDCPSLKCKVSPNLMNVDGTGNIEVDLGGYWRFC